MRNICKEAANKRISAVRYHTKFDTHADAQAQVDNTSQWK